MSYPLQVFGGCISPVDVTFVEFYAFLFRIPSVSPVFRSKHLSCMCNVYWAMPWSTSVIEHISVMPWSTAAIEHISV